MKTRFTRFRPLAAAAIMAGVFALLSEIAQAWTTLIKEREGQ